MYLCIYVSMYIIYIYIYPDACIYCVYKSIGQFIAKSRKAWTEKPCTHITLAFEKKDILLMAEAFPWNGDSIGYEKQEWTWVDHRRTDLLPVGFMSKKKCRDSRDELFRIDIYYIFIHTYVYHIDIYHIIYTCNIHIIYIYIWTIWTSTPGSTYHVDWWPAPWLALQGPGS